MNNQIIENLKWREATKAFDKDKKISDVDMNIILESARLAPSSFGVEPWKFLVIKNQELKAKIQKSSWNQGQVGTNDTLLVLLYRKDVGANSEYVKDLITKRVPSEMFDTVFGMYNGAMGNKTKEEVNNWADKQAHIASGVIMTTLSSLRIDSCAIGGFSEEEVSKILELDTEKYGISMLLPIGYRAKDGRPKSRLSSDEVIEIIE